MFQNLPEYRLLHPRRRATSLTDGKRYIYIMGSTLGKTLSIERFDIEKEFSEEICELPTSEPIYLLSACLC